ncbi:mRNA cleavage and polyadenylation factor subunit [Gaertneriomyces sp. JEL0708]|nr:mRNA cleavage and polyadenylation factor subunit [Gaertneriomyces sp. JEL0708]
MSTIYSLYKELLPPSGIDHVATASFTGPEVTNLIVAQSNLLRIYEVNEKIQGNSGESLDRIARLRLVHEEYLNGIITSIGTVRTATGVGAQGLDSLLLAFKDAKVCLLEWSVADHTLTTVSLHYFERDEFRKESLTPPRPPILRVDPQSRCAVVLFYEDRLAIIPLKSELSASNEEPEPFWPSFVVSLSSLEGMKRLGSVTDLVFLEGYLEPTLAIMWQADQTWTGRLTHLKDTQKLSVISLSLSATVPSTPLFQTPSLPYNAHTLLAMPMPVGGTLVLCNDGVIYVQRGETTSCGVNPWWGIPKFTNTDEEFVNEDGTITVNPKATEVNPVYHTPQGYDHKHLGLSLAGCSAVSVNPDSVLTVLADGEMISIFLDGGEDAGRGWNRRRAGVRGIRVAPGRLKAHRSSCATRISINHTDQQSYVFLGSRVSDGLLVRVRAQSGAMSLSNIGGEESWTAEEAQNFSSMDIDVNDNAEQLDDSLGDEELDDIYGSSLQASSAVKRKASVGLSQHVWQLKVTDQLAVHSPIRDFALGGNGEIVMCVEDGIIVGREGVHPLVAVQHTMEDAAQITNLWALPDGDSSGHLFVTYEQSTTALRCGSWLDPSTWTAVDESTLALLRDQRTVAVGRLDGKIVQVGERDIWCESAGATSLTELLELSGSDEMDVDGDATPVTRESVTAAYVSETNLVHVQVERRSCVLRFTSEPNGERWTKVGALDGVGYLCGKESKWIVANENSIHILNVTEAGAKEVWKCESLRPILRDEASVEGPLLDDKPKKLWIGDVGGVLCIAILTTRDDLVLFKSFSAPSRHGRLPLSFRYHSRTPVHTDACHGIDFKEFHSLGHNNGVKYSGVVVGDVWIMGAVGGGLGGGIWRVPGDEGTKENRLELKMVMENNVRTQGHGEIAIHRQRSNGQPMALDLACSNFNGFIARTPTSLVVAQLDPSTLYTPRLPLNRVPLGRTAHKVAFWPGPTGTEGDFGMYVVATSTPIDWKLCAAKVDAARSAGVDPDESDVAQIDNNDYGKGGKVFPTVGQWFLELVSPRGWRVVDTIPMEQYEQILALATVHVTSSQTRSGKKFVIVSGTGTQRGEDLACRGRVLVHDVSGIVPDPETPWVTHKFKKLFIGEEKSPVTALCGVGGNVGVAVGSKIIIHQFDEAEQLSGVAFLDVNMYVTCLRSIKNLVVVSDILKGVWFCGFQEEPPKLVLISKDYNPSSSLAASFLLSGAEAQKSLQIVSAEETGLSMMQFAPYTVVSHNGQALVKRGDFVCGRVSQLREWANGSVVGTTLDGAIFLLRPVPEKQFKRLSAVFTKLCSALPWIGGLNPRGWRYHSRGSGGLTGNRCVLDYDLLRRWEELDEVTKKGVAKGIGLVVERVDGDLNEAKRFGLW